MPLTYSWALPRPGSSSGALGGGVAPGGSDPPTDEPPTTTNNVYIRSGGTGSGTSWSDARSTLPTLARDTTYWIGGGMSLGNVDFTTANSGTSPVVLRKATIASHGTNTGWNDSYASGQTTFGQILVQKDYLYVYGGGRNESNWRDVAAYGFWVDNFYSTTDVGVTAGHYLTATYCDIGRAYDENPSAATINTYGNPVYMAGSVAQTGWRINRCCVHNGKGTLFQCNGVDSLTIERTWIGPGWTKEGIRGQGSFTNCIVRYNFLYNTAQKDPNDGSSGITAEIGIFSNAGGGGTYDGNEFYGNVIFSNINETGRNTVVVIGGNNGAGWDGTPGNNNKFYNNTIAGMPTASGSAMILLNGGTGNEAKNNLFYDTVDSDVSANTVSNNVKATVNPFVNYAGLNFRINSGSQADGAGVDVGNSPYNVDQDGTSREGRWSVGAFEVAS